MEYTDVLSGSAVKAAIMAYRQCEGNAERTKAVMDVFYALSHAEVVLPCTASFSFADGVRLSEMLADREDDMESFVGEVFTAQDAVHMRPDILQGGDRLFMPVFTAEEEMGEYGTHFSKVERLLLDVIPLAEGHGEELSGIVVNPFTDNFVLIPSVYSLVRKMGSVQVVHGME